MCARARIGVCERVFARDGSEYHSYACACVRITLNPIPLFMLDAVLVACLFTCAYACVHGPCVCMRTHKQICT